MFTAWFSGGRDDSYSVMSERFEEQGIDHEVRDVDSFDEVPHPNADEGILVVFPTEEDARKASSLGPVYDSDNDTILHPILGDIPA